MNKTKASFYLLFNIGFQTFHLWYFVKFYHHIDSVDGVWRVRSMQFSFCLNPGFFLLSFPKMFHRFFNSYETVHRSCKRIPFEHTTNNFYRQILYAYNPLKAFFITIHPSQQQQKSFKYFQVFGKVLINHF